VWDVCVCVCVCGVCVYVCVWCVCVCVFMCLCICMCVQSHMCSYVGCEGGRRYNPVSTLILYLQGDTLQNAITDLENILQTGWFKFLLNPEGIGGVHAPPQVILEYSPIGPDTQRSAGGGGRVQSEESLAVHRPSCVATRKERWDSGEISNFVQMLGLLDQGKSDHTAKIMKFQSLNEVST